MQDSIDRYTDSELQVFTEDSKSNPKNLIYSNPTKQAFNLLKKKCITTGSNFEVKASSINF